MERDKRLCANGRGLLRCKSEERTLDGIGSLNTSHVAAGLQ
jgi:hypothetical protein